MGGGMRTAPSAGALYLLDIYVLVKQVKGVPEGLQKYKSDAHQLLQVNTKNLSNELCEAALNQEMLKESPVCLIYTAIFERTTSKYGDCGRERYVWIDLGHSAQNVYLQAEALHLGACAIGAFNDNKVREVLNLPAEEEPLYLMPLGFYYKKEME
jgi:SagB-type dehydrogenase family enzyme